MATTNPVISDAASFEAVHRYVCALGMIALGWNNLHEKLGEIFVTLLFARNRTIGRAVWYKPTNDRQQRELLMAVIEAAQPQLWEKLPSRAQGDLLEFLKKINVLGYKRDDAIHAPVLFDDVGEPQIIADFLSDHRRAKNLVGKDLLVEFDYLDRYIKAMADFAEHVIRILRGGGRAPWPSIPRAPDRKAKNVR